MDINWSFAEVQAALVYATGIFAGAIVAAAAVFWEWHGKNSGERERLERGLSRKMRNTLCAIKAEIDTELVPLERGYGAQVAPALKAAFKEQHREGTVKPLPRAPVAAMLYEQDRLCLALEFVPPPLAKRITTFYKAMYALNAMQAMINSGAFDDINDARQDAIIDGLFTLASDAIRAGTCATRDIEAILELRRPFSAEKVQLSMLDS